MIVRIDKSFERDTSKIKDRTLLKKIADCIEQVQSAATLSDIRGLKRLTGYRTEHRIKMGDYRIGVLVKKETVEFIRFLHRKEIYRFFP